jgi:hypothetical protein
VRLRPLRVRKPVPVIRATNPAIISHSTFAPVVASFGTVLVTAGADEGATSASKTSSIPDSVISEAFD